MNINNAVVHVFDFASCSNTFSQVELDLSSKNAKRYVTGHAKRALGNIDAKRGEFAEGSMFAEELRGYFRKQVDFVELSVQIAEFLARELGHMEKPESADLLVVDFEDEPNATVRDMTDEEAEAAWRAQGKRYFGLMLLDSRQAYMHEVDFTDNGATRVNVVRHHAVLPNPSQKVASFALIDADTLAVSFCDKPRTIAGEERLLIPDGLLQCSANASSKEVLTEVTRIVEEVAEEYGENAAVAVSKAKAYACEAVEENEELAPWELAEEVFEDGPARQRFEEALVQEAMPERVPVERAAAKRVAKSHRIITDTGIEIKFPAEYAQSPEFIEFTSESDGSLSISLRNIAHIENK